MCFICDTCLLIITCLIYKMGLRKGPVYCLAYKMYLIKFTLVRFIAVSRLTSPSRIMVSMRQQKWEYYTFTLLDSLLWKLIILPRSWSTAFPIKLSFSQPLIVFLLVLLLYTQFHVILVVRGIIFKFRREADLKFDSRGTVLLETSPYMTWLLWFFRFCWCWCWWKVSC